MLLGAGTWRITEISQRFADRLPPHASLGATGLVLAGGPGLLEMQQPHTSDWGEQELLGLVAKVFLAPGLIPAADVSPQCLVELQKVSQLLRRAAALTELLKSRWCQMSLKYC